MTGIGRLHHVGIAAPELAPAADNVCALLEGVVVDGGEDADFGVVWTWIESEGNPIVEVLAPTHADGPVARWLERHDAGLHHLSFVPAGLDGALDHARCCGLGILGEDRSHPGYEQFYVDPKATGGALFHSFRLKSG